MDRAKSERWHFGGLYWRVTVSYFLVTLLAALTLEAATTVGAFLQEVQNVWQITSVPFNTTLEQREAPQVAPYLEETPPDLEAMQRWLPGPLFHAINYAQPSFMAVVGQHGQVLAAAFCSSPKRVTSEAGQCVAADAAQAAGVLAPAPIQETIYAALSGDPGPIHTVSPGPEERLVFAVPVLGKARQVLGTLVAFIAEPGVGGGQTISFSNGGELVSIFLRNLQPAAFYFVLLATVIGTITGVLISRSITRRLRRITLAAGAWSQGNFQAAVRDASHDEVGQLAQDLNHMAEQLHALVATQHRMAMLEERQRWQRDLHDAVKQQVFAATMQIAAARACFATDTSQSYQHIIEAEHLAGQAQRELTTLIEAGQPDSLAGKPFAEVLDDLCQQWSRQAGIPMKLQVEGQCDLPPDVEVALYRVVQEALANIMRHSAATRVAVRLHKDEDRVTLVILDNGQGFDPTVATAGFGLRNMRERIAALGGDLVIASSPEGTQITARMSRRQGGDDDA
ncbi:MAG TPA: sensor histidine kinase [Ktedonobacterales bacterium]|nr:sensor histidine kinase [Ktedonobacterales bacterium]